MRSWFLLPVLHSRFPDWTLEAIKSLRNKNLRYKEILAALEAEEVDGELPAESLSPQPHDSADADSSWVGHFDHRERAPGRGHRPAPDATNRNHDLDPQRRRHAQFSAIQHLYGRKPSACAHKVLDGSWESGDPGPAPTLEQLRSTWQPTLRLHLSKITDGRQVLDQ